MTEQLVRVEPPIWTRRMFAVAVVLGMATLLTFALGAVRSAQDQRDQNHDLKEQAAGLQEQVERLNASTECRSQRQAELNAITSDLTGTLAQMVVLISNKDNPQSFGPVLAQLQTQADQREAAKQAALNAVKDCKGS